MTPQIKESVINMLDSMMMVVDADLVLIRIKLFHSSSKKYLISLIHTNYLVLFQEKRNS
jgi:hypothetical protein